MIYYMPRPHLVKKMTRGGGVKNCQFWDDVVCECPLVPLSGFIRHKLSVYTYKVHTTEVYKGPPTQSDDDKNQVQVRFFLLFVHFCTVQLQGNLVWRALFICILGYQWWWLATLNSFTGYLVPKKWFLPLQPATSLDLLFHIYWWKWKIWKEGGG